MMEVVAQDGHLRYQQLSFLFDNMPPLPKIPRVTMTLPFTSLVNKIPTADILQYSLPLKFSVDLDRVALACAPSIVEGDGPLIEAS